MTRVQVVYASRHGGTAGIAQRIAEVLRNEGNDVVVADAADRPDPSGFDAYVIGSGVQIDHSKLAQTEKLISDIKKQLDVAERVLAHKAKFVDSIPVESTVNEKELLTEVDAYLAPEAPKVRQATGANGQCPAEEQAEVTRADRF